MKQPPPFVVMSTWCIPIRRLGWPMSDSIFTCSACGPGGSTLLPPPVRMRRCPRMRLGSTELGPLINGTYVAAGLEESRLLASWLK